MENKKLLKYLLKDLSELEEMFAEKGKNSFDELEMEFIQNRISGAQKLVQLFLEKENEMPANVQTVVASQPKNELQNSDLREEKPKPIKEKPLQEISPVAKTSGVSFEEKSHEIVAEKFKPEPEIEEKAVESLIEEKVVVVENNIVAPEIVQEIKDEKKEHVEEEVTGQSEAVKTESKGKEIHLDEEEPVDIHNKRLGDSFLKEKSVNDLMSDDSSKLEHKLSNRPVSSIQSAIGINDRFQYIRELFEGSADNFVKAVSDLDSMDDIKEAVDYMQSNFKWKKNETSLKFINLIKRRFPHE